MDKVKAGIFAFSICVWCVIGAVAYFLYSGGIASIFNVDVFKDTLGGMMSPNVRLSAGRDKLAFSYLRQVEVNAGASDVFVADLRGGTVQQMTDDGASGMPVWLDNDTLAYRSTIKQGLARLDISSMEETVAEVQSNAISYPFGFNFRSALDGTIVVFEVLLPRKADKAFGFEFAKSLHVIDVETGEVSRLESFAIGSGPFSWLVSPAGVEVVILNAGKVYAINLTDGTRRDIIVSDDITAFDYAPPLLAFIMRSDGAGAVWIRNLEAASDAVVENAGACRDVRLSPGGQFIACVIGSETGIETWVYAASGGEGRKVFDDGRGPVWISEEELIIQLGGTFDMDGPAPLDIYRVKSDGSDAERIFPLPLDDEAGPAPPSSPDLGE